MLVTHDRTKSRRARNLGIIISAMASATVFSAFHASVANAEETLTEFLDSLNPLDQSTIPAIPSNETVPQLFATAVSDWQLVTGDANTLEAAVADSQNNQAGILGDFINTFQPATANVLDNLQAVDQTLPVSEQTASLAGQVQSLIGGSSVLDSWYNYGTTALPFWDNLPQWDMGIWLENVLPLSYDEFVGAAAQGVIFDENPIISTLDASTLVQAYTTAQDSSTSGLFLEPLASGFQYAAQQLTADATFGLDIFSTVCAFACSAAVTGGSAASTAADETAAMAVLEADGATSSTASEILSSFQSGLLIDPGQAQVIASSMMTDGLSMSQLASDLQDQNSIDDIVLTGLIDISNNGDTFTTAETQLLSETLNALSNGTTVTAAQIAQGFNIPTWALTPITDSVGSGAAPVVSSTSAQILSAVGDVGNYLQTDGLDATAIGAIEQSLSSGSGLDQAAYDAMMTSVGDGFGNLTEVANTLSTVIDAQMQGGNLALDVLAALPLAG